MNFNCFPFIKKKGKVHIGTFLRTFFCLQPPEKKTPKKSEKMCSHFSLKRFLLQKLL